MKTCASCSSRLNFLNKPFLGIGKINYESDICSKCYAEQRASFTNRRQLKSDQKKEAMLNYLQEQAEETKRRKLKLEKVKKRILDLKLDNVSTFFGRTEINELPEILKEDELIDHIVQGAYCDRQGILVSTNLRLLFIDKGVLFGLKVEEFLMSKLTAVEYETGTISANIKVYSTDKMGMFDNVEKSSAKRFAEFVAKKLR